MGKSHDNVIEFPDSTENVKVAFSEKDMKLLEETEITTDTSHVSLVYSPNAKFTATIVVLSSGGLFQCGNPMISLQQILLYCIASLCPLVSGLLSIIVGLLVYEWQRMYAPSLTRTPRATFNYGDLLQKNKDYIPFYSLGWLLGEKYKPFVLPCTPAGGSDDRTPNEPDAVSPERLVPTDPKFYR
ncbi:hypothetical protein ANCCAN_07986 [Ancylostoma caninum]|uniref:Uncharacterized protein n=1 Tax=Ancylostoma caninum TaxID=29170 RepID=A0A368GSE0_ANCCA|nr:hypothetical protein ANCCAN_07986 [Ancylostoma caninum]